MPRYRTFRTQDTLRSQNYALDTSDAAQKCLETLRYVLCLATKRLGSDVYCFQCLILPALAGAVSIDHFIRPLILTFHNVVNVSTRLKYVWNFNDCFYRAMHFSAERGLVIACRLSVCDVGDL